MKCPNCGVLWVGFYPGRSTTTNSGICSRCGAGPYIADEVQTRKEFKEETAKVAKEIK